jgi:hypothetical protein
MRRHKNLDWVVAGIESIATPSNVAVSQSQIFDSLTASFNLSCRALRGFPSSWWSHRHVS